MNTPALDQLFGPRILYPDVDYQERLSRLVGLDNQKERITKIMRLLVNPIGLENWAKKHHPGVARRSSRRDQASPYIRSCHVSKGSQNRRHAHLH